MIDTQFKVINASCNSHHLIYFNTALFHQHFQRELSFGSELGIISFIQTYHLRRDIWVYAQQRQYFDDLWSAFRSGDSGAHPPPRQLVVRSV